MDENSLTHYGVLGMKWGKRKQKVSKGSNTKKSSKSNQSSKKTSNVKKKIQNIASKVDKEKVKSIAKTTAIVAGSVAVTATLGTLGSVAYSQMMNNFNQSQTNLHNLHQKLGSAIDTSIIKKEYPQITGESPLVRRGFGMNEDQWRMYKLYNSIGKTRIK